MIEEHGGCEPKEGCERAGGALVEVPDLGVERRDCVEARRSRTEANESLGREREHAGARTSPTADAGRWSHAPPSQEDHMRRPELKDELAERDLNTRRRERTEPTHLVGVESNVPDGVRPAVDDEHARVPPGRKGFKHKGQRDGRRRRTSAVKYAPRLWRMRSGGTRRTRPSARFRCSGGYSAARRSKVERPSGSWRTWAR